MSVPREKSLRPPGRPTLSDTKRKNVGYRLRLSQDELDAITHVANKLDISTAELIRNAINLYAQFIGEPAGIVEGKEVV